MDLLPYSLYTEYNVFHAALQYQRQNNKETENIKTEKKCDLLNKEIPKSSEIYISTKTKIVYLSESIDLKTNFWKISLVDYSNPCEGVIKKQMKCCTLYLVVAI